jgi:hypothetical protein
MTQMITYQMTGQTLTTTQQFDITKYSAGELILGKPYEEVGDFARNAETTKNASKPANDGKAVVIGEGMNNVKSAAKQLQAEGINAKWYQAWNKNFPDGRKMTPVEMDAAKVRNQRWIDSKITQGYDIYDIGVEAGRDDRSPFYTLEKERIEHYNYPTIPFTGGTP